MRIHRKRHAVNTLALLMMMTAALATAGTPAASRAEIGKPAPAFSLNDVDGKSHALADLAGKIVVLEWTNPNCPVVRRVYSSGIMSALQKEYVARGVVWLTINSTNTGHDDHETAGDQKKLYASWKASPTAQLLDPAGSVGRSFEARTTPHMFVIDTNGVLVYNGAIDDDPRGSAGQPKNYVKEALEALFAGKTVATTVTKPYGCGVKY